MRQHRVRRGQAAVQWIVIAGVIILAIAATITTLGSRANNKLNETATDVANPASLKNRFGS
jgi:Flp pilus assembly pilin Flp